MIYYKIIEGILDLYEGDDVPRGYKPYNEGDDELATFLSQVAQAEEKNKRIAELKRLLQESDYAVLPDYDKPSEEMKAQRQAWRDELRGLE